MSDWTVLYYDAISGRLQVMLFRTREISGVEFLKWGDRVFWDEWDKVYPVETSNRRLISYTKGDHVKATTVACAGPVQITTLPLGYGVVP